MVSKGDNEKVHHAPMCRIELDNYIDLISELNKPIFAGGNQSKLKVFSFVCRCLSALCTPERQLSLCLTRAEPRQVRHRHAPIRRSMSIGFRSDGRQNAGFDGRETRGNFSLHHGVDYAL